jgi:hypothetical protein
MDTDETRRGFAEHGYELSIRLQLCQEPLSLPMLLQKSRGLPLALDCPNSRFAVRPADLATGNATRETVFGEGPKSRRQSRPFLVHAVTIASDEARARPHPAPPRSVDAAPGEPGAHGLAHPAELEKSEWSRRSAGCHHHGQPARRDARGEAPMKPTCSGRTDPRSGRLECRPGRPMLMPVQPSHGVEFATTTAHAALELEQQERVLELGEGQAASLDEDIRVPVAAPTHDLKQVERALVQRPKLGRAVMDAMTRFVALPLSLRPRRGAFAIRGVPSLPRCKSALLAKLATVCRAASRKTGSASALPVIRSLPSCSRR